MRKKFILPAVGLMVLYVISNYYIGLRLWQSIGALAAPEMVSYYWIIFSLVAGAYFLGRLGAIYFPGDYSDRAIWYGSHWLGLAFYLLLFWLAYDSAARVGLYIGVFAPEGSLYSAGAGAAILAAALGITAYGVRNAGIPRVRHYDITINKQAGSCKELHVVMISDLHLGLLVGRERLMRGVQIINELDPDIVLMPGDILDENVGAFVENKMPEVLRGIQSRFGVFGILGSHEYIYGHSEKALTYLKQAGITILRDQYIKLPNDVYIVGRDDLFREQLVGTPRQTLEMILKSCNRGLPIILMDHQPVDLEEAQLQGVDLQLSGHTHHGQIFPMGLLTRAHFEIDWGYLRKKQYQIIVSCGYGTWVAPLRVGTISEIVDITIKFAPCD
ncbi:MAG: metallophosphoesterase [Sporomusaceae bacterium]|nr:metallophosphoesterase [Sporomusaceae bacterium]